MALTEVPIELSSTPGIVDNSTATAITIDASQNVTLSANLTVNGDLITFGDANTDSIDFNAEISSNLIPSGARDLGSVGKEWTNLYISGTGDVATLTSASSTIGTLTVSTTATIPYDNVTSGLTAVNIQSALDELAVLTGGGNVGSQANFDVYEFTATNLQTTFDLNATYSETYVPGYIQVYLNGLLLSETDYVASNGDTVVLNSGADTDDILAIVVLDSFNTATQLRVLSIDASASDDAISVDATDNVTLLGELRGPATFVIDPAAIGDNTGTVQIKGNLQVDGTQTTINSTTLDVTDLNITVASGAADAASANGAGITVDGAAANITYTSATDSWDFNKNISVNGSTAASVNILIENTQVSGDADSDINLKTASTGGELRINFDHPSATSPTFIQGDDRLNFAPNGTVAMTLENDGTINFYEDTGVTPKLTWNPSTESLGIGTTTNLNDQLTVGNDTDGVTAKVSGAVSTLRLGAHDVFGAAGRFDYDRSSGYLTYKEGVYDSEGSELLTITNIGNVAIGGGTPSTLLHVIETDSGAPDAIVRIESDDTADSRSLLQFVGRNNSNVATYATIFTDAVAAGTNAPIVFSQGVIEANERMRIDESGNVTIGAPVNNDADAQLHVYGLGQTTADLADSGDMGATLRLSDVNTAVGSGGAIVFANQQGDVANSAGFAAIKGLLSNGNTNTQGHIAFSTRDSITDTALTERMRVTSGGNVGINENDPDAYLHLSGLAANSAVAGVILEGAWPWLKFKDTETNQDTYTFYNDNALYLTRLSFADSGNAPNGGTNLFNVGTSETVFNNDGVDQDFRVESNSNNYAFFLDAGNNVIGTGTSTPATYVNSGGLAVKGSTVSDLALVSTSVGSGSNSHQIRYYNESASSYEIARTQVNVGAGQVNRGEYQFSVNNGAGLRPWLDVNYAGDVVFNQQGYDSDFRVESVNNANMLQVDAGNDTVSIGTSNTPTNIGVSAPSLNVTGGIQVAGTYKSTLANPNGRVFTLSTGTNGAATWLKLEGGDHLGYRSTYFRCHNVSGNWIVNASNVVTDGTPPTFTVANNSTANPTITLGFDTSYSGGFVSVEMNSSYFIIS